MNIQSIGEFRIERQPSKDGSPIYSRATVCYNGVNRTYQSPLSLLNDETSVLRMHLGISDVDYLYALYNQYPNWFHGSSEEAFRNRESVFNLTLNLLGENYLELLRETAPKCVRFGQYMIRMFSDVFRSIYYQAKVNEIKPRYSPYYHMDLIRDVLNDDMKEAINRNPEYTNDGGYRVEDLKPLFDTDGDTREFILDCLKVGGIGKLVEVLYLFYGTIVGRYHGYRHMSTQT